MFLYSLENREIISLSLSLSLSVSLSLPRARPPSSVTSKAFCDSMAAISEAGSEFLWKTLKEGQRLRMVAELRDEALWVLPLYYLHQHLAVILSRVHIPGLFATHIDVHLAQFVGRHRTHRLEGSQCVCQHTRPPPSRTSLRLRLPGGAQIAGNRIFGDR